MNTPSPAAPPKNIHSCRGIEDLYEVVGPDLHALMQGEAYRMLDLMRDGRPLPPRPSARKLVDFWSYDHFLGYEIPANCNLVGDFHIQKGAPFVLAGAPGTGKSRAVVALAIAGAMGAGTDWFGLPVHSRFRTMILQCENGPVRLRRELQDISLPPEVDMDQWLRISPPPPEGFRFDSVDFIAQLHFEIQQFKPDVFILDPWTRLAEDNTAGDYRRAFDLLLGALPEGDERPAVGIVAHTRKPRFDERANGRALLNVVSGSFVLTAAARAVFVLQHASDDVEETRVVMTCAKNNDGHHGPRSAWERRNGLFRPVETFDWEAFDDRAERQTRSLVTGQHLREVFAGGMLPRAEAVNRLIQISGVGRTKAYDALSLEGEFREGLRVTEGLLSYECGEDGA